jgi:hypothetical protein
VRRLSRETTASASGTPYVTPWRTLRPGAMPYQTRFVRTVAVPVRSLNAPAEWTPIIPQHDIDRGNDEHGQQRR